MRLPADCHVQNGCWNCHYAYVEKDSAEAGLPTIYCTWGAPNPPTPLSEVKAKLVSEGRPLTECLTALGDCVKTWTKWSEGRSVIPAGICSCFLSEDEVGFPRKDERLFNYGFR